jgi:hypothetical protein
MPRSPFDLTDQPPPERPLRADTAAGHLCRDGSRRVGRQDREHDRHHRVRYVVVDLELGRTMARTHRSRSCGTTLAPLGAIPCIVQATASSAPRAASYSSWWWLAAGLLGCQDPTQVRLHLRTDVPYDQGRLVSFTAAPPDRVEGAETDAVLETPWGSTGEVGTMVVVPEDDRNGKLGIRVVMGVTRGPPPANRCSCSAISLNSSSTHPRSLRPPQAG